MNTYKIPITVEMTGEYIVKANSLEEALSDYRKNGSTWPLPDDLMYVDGSEELNHDCIGYVNEDVLTDKEREEYNL